MGDVVEGRFSQKNESILVSIYASIPRSFNNVVLSVNREGYGLFHKSDRDNLTGEWSDHGVVSILTAVIYGSNVGICAVDMGVEGIISGRGIVLSSSIYEVITV